MAAQRRTPKEAAGMSTLNIAIVGGVVLLILVLAKMRRLNAAETPSSGRGRVKGEKRRKRGKDTPPAPPEPMPLAAAAGQTAATTSEPPVHTPAPEWPATEEPGPEQWPPVGEGSPVEWPAVGDSPAPAGVEHPHHQDEPEGFEPAAPATWAEDELVTEPGWPMPGESDVAWSPPPVHHPSPVAAEPAMAWNDESAAAVTPPHLEWLSAEPAEEEAPVWAPAESEPAPADFSPQQADEAQAWGASFEQDAQPTGEIPIVAAFEAAPEIAPEQEYDFASEQEYSSHEADLPGEDPFAAPEIVVDVAPEPQFEPDPEPEPVAIWDEVSSPASASVSSEPSEAWWDDESEIAVVPEVAVATPVEDDGAFTGRFALGGFAVQPGQHALGGVTFRVDLAQAPTTWVVDAAPGAVGAGTLNLVLDGTINCAAEGLEVVMEPGFAPTTQGFTVRVAALAAGPFAASGTFRVY
jgi:hypothetical protein